MREFLECALQRGERAGVLQTRRPVEVLFELLIFDPQQLAVQFAEKSFDHEVHPIGFDVVERDRPELLQRGDDDGIAAMTGRAGV